MGAPRIAVRTIYLYTCTLCGGQDEARFPYNPMQETPGPMQAVPSGWTVWFDGDNPQTPVALCGCSTREGTT